MTSKLSNLRILITGANGFIGQNLLVRLGELENITVTTFVRGDDPATLFDRLACVDAVVHLAGENRPIDDSAFFKTNLGLTLHLCSAVKKHFEITSRHIPLLFASSSQAGLDNLYGKSKLAAEKELYALNNDTGNPCVVFRLPGVFGKWSKPNFNSVVATFCYNLSRNLPIHINDSDSSVRLVYIDDVIDSFLHELSSIKSCYKQSSVNPEYVTTLGSLASRLSLFSDSRTSLITCKVGSGFTRALYATYVSYLPNEQFSYTIPKHSDSRGVFIEMIKSPESGQFSYFTAYPGVTRGCHYHHTKSEKFLVVKGEALFRFRNLLTDEIVEFSTSEALPEVVDTIPGWIHAITNIGDTELIVMLWANEIFNRNNPDTVAAPI